MSDIVINRQSLGEAFATLGLHAGMNLILHSSLSSLGYVDGEADAVIDALQDVLTKQGTLVMPSFNHGKPYEEGELFDIRRTGTTNGIIPDTFWRRSDVLRSMNPTHAFAAWGRHARRYTANHQEVAAMGKGSPLDLLMKDDGYCLLLGVGYSSNTFHHFVETDTGAPCLSQRGEVYPVRDADGHVIMAYTWGWRESACPINDSALYAREMASSGLHRQTSVGQATVTLYRLSDGYTVIARCLHDGYQGFPPCSQCRIRPRVCKYTVK